MERTITVKGTGNLSIKPNFIEIDINLETKNMNYEDAYNNSLDKISKLNDAIVDAGFSKEDLKTTNFNINTEYKSVRNENDEYQQVFDGYRVYHSLKIGFEFDINKLNEVLAQLTKSENNPNLSIRFTINNQAEVNEELLESAANNARQTAEILCKASNVNLGDLVKIDYNWKDINLYSQTNYSAGMAMEASARKSMDIVPEDIEIKDTATFVWEIK